MIRFNDLGGCALSRAPLFAPLPSWVDPVGSLVGSGLSLLGTHLTNNSNERIAESTNATNMAINEAQLKHQLEQWKRETSYNDPAAQVQRLRSAGLNPQSLVSNGNAQPLNISSPIPAQSYQKQNIIPDNVFGNAVDAFNRGLMSREELTRQKRENYLLGVNASFAISRQVSDLREQWSRIAASNADTEYKKRQMKDIQDRIEILQAQEQRQAKIDNQTLSNLQADEQEKRAYTSRQDMLALAQKRHWSSQDAVAWFNAQNQKLVIDDKLLSSDLARDLQRQMYRWLDTKHGLEAEGMAYSNDLKRLQVALNSLDKIKREQLLSVIAIQVGHEKQKDMAILGRMLRESFGVDLKDVFPGLSKELFR